MKKSRWNVAGKWLIFWTLFISVGAIAGSCGMLLDPSGKALGMDRMLPYFRALPFSDVLFRDLTFSGFALLIVNGLTNLVAAGLLFAKKRSGLFLGMLFGITLMLWICIQFIIFPVNFMSTLYFVFGLAQAITGYASIVFYKQEHFDSAVQNEENIGSDPSKLVVFFSRMGYTERVARQLAADTGAVVWRLETPESTQGTGGFWWCGRFGLTRREMELSNMTQDLERYEHVTVVTPIWVFHIAAPVHTFCRLAKGKIRSVDYVVLHYRKSRYESAASEMDELLGVTHTAFCSISCRKGKMKTICRKEKVNQDSSSLFYPNCPCIKLNCSRHGNCEKCRAHHDKKSNPVACER